MATQVMLPLHLQASKFFTGGLKEYIERLAANSQLTLLKSITVYDFTENAVPFDKCEFVEDETSFKWGAIVTDDVGNGELVIHDKPSAA